MRIFGVWNRTYFRYLFLAETIEEAIQHAIRRGHMRKPHNYRRLEDCTEKVHEEYMEAHGSSEKIAAVLEAGQQGELTWDRDGVLHIDGKPLTLD